MNLVLVGIFCIAHVLAAASAAQRGKAALLAAEGSLSARNLTATRSDLDEASQAFDQTRRQVQALGPIASVARRIPLVSNQIKAVDTFASAGLSLSTAGRPLVDAADVILHPADDKVPVSAAMDALRSTQASLGPAVAAIEGAAQQVARLHGEFLVGPLARARDDLATRLPRIEQRAVSADDGLSALLAFAGGSGPKRYLFLSQNPDEPRPTGGFIGTYGVLTADGGKLSLERYDSIESWTTTHPQAQVPADQAGSPFQYSNPPLRRTLANVNSTPDWPSAAQLAANLWQAAGEAPVDGVISFTPGFMGRVLGVLGPVSIPAYDETVTAANISERLDFYTHHAATAPGENRKDFVAAVAEAVMHELLDAPASQWEPLGQAVAQAFDARQALAWSSDPAVAGTLAARHWDGAFPTQAGDFVFDSEFAYASKNGQGLHRTFDHEVTLKPDGSAHITTTMTLTNTDPPDPVGNVSSLAYLTQYGPAGGVLDQAGSDPFGLSEPNLAGHPAVGWFRAAQPGGGQVTLKVAWDVPGVATRQKDGSWRYDLRWLHPPDHTGDVVNLKVVLPAGWKWKGGGPPAQFNLDQDFAGSWTISGN